MRCCGDGVLLTAQPRMPFPSEHHFKSLSAHGFHRVVYRQWGDPENAHIVVCVHGLTRNGRDFDTFDQLETHIRQVSAPFGALSEDQWEALARSTARQEADGRWRLKFDPGIGVPFRATGGQGGDLWPLWGAISCPTLVLRGAESDL